MISINTNAKNIKNYVENLKKAMSNYNIRFDIDMFECGVRGGVHYGQSYVDVRITGSENTEGEIKEIWFKIYAGGYGDVVTWVPIREAIKKEFNFKHNSKLANTELLRKLENN